jgi:hypothetical protein
VDVLTCKNNHVFVIIISTPFHLRVAILSTDDYSTSSVYRVSNDKTETHRRQIRILGINIAAARLVRVARRRKLVCACARSRRLVLGSRLDRCTCSLISFVDQRAARCREIADSSPQL